MEASIHVDRGNDSMAMTRYREVTRTAPLLIDAWAQLGWLFDRHGRSDSSDVCYERALQIDPRNPFVCNNYAYSLALRRTDIQRALQLSATSLESEPNNASYLDTYAWILYHLARYDEAEKAARHAIEVGGNATHHEHYGMIQEARGDITAAIAAWQRALELDPARVQLKAKIDRYK
jgi:Flp pilus assembly protein TadD